MESYGCIQPNCTRNMEIWRIRKNVRKRWRYGRVVMFSVIISFCLIVPLHQNRPYTWQIISSDQSDNARQSQTRIEAVPLNGLIPSTSLKVESANIPSYGHLPFAKKRRLLQSFADTTEVSPDTTGSDSNAGNYTTIATPVSTTGTAGNEFPEDLFSEDQLKKGAVVLHILGIAYMFIALAITCDEFFVPSLEVITSTLGISEDVAGATFMAAGGSAPELFTSFIGVFAAKSEVGIGTIIGSAVFNILFVIGMCAVFSQGVLHLTWWPLFRDVSFYSISLILLIAFFVDQKIYWWEALVLFLCYIAYVTFMKFNRTAERTIKKIFGLQPPSSTQSNAQFSSKESNGIGCDIVQEAGNSAFRQGLLHLLLKTMDPLDSSKVSEAPRRLQAIAESTFHSNSNSPSQRHSGQSEPDCQFICQSQRDSVQSPQQSITSQKSNGLSNVVSCGAITIDAPSSHSPPFAEEGMVSDSIAMSTLSIQSNGSGGNYVKGHKQIHNHGVASGIKSVVNSLTPVADGSIFTVENGTRRPSVPENQCPVAFDCAQNGTEQPGIQMTTVDVDGVMHNGSLGVVRNGRGRLNTLGTINKQDLPEDEPLDLSWPHTWKKRFIYVMLIPISFPLAITLPDVRKKSHKKWFPWTFLGSILWIGSYSYLMNWWASIVGDVIGIKPAVMGMTFLAAGTSIPDLITSVIVAKKGLGDMAVSSSVGSNIFDVTVGLPLPWLIYGLLYKMPYTVNSKGLLCSVILLFTMLTLLIIMIAAFKWQMTHRMGAAMFVMYLVFICLALLLYYEKIPCPTVVL